MTTITTLSDAMANATIFNLDIHIWSGVARVRREDLPDEVVQALPPAELATLGSKKLIDPTILNVFKSLKTQAWSACNDRGTRFLGGFLVANDSADNVIDKLVDLRDKFNDKAYELLANYDDLVDEWVAQQSSEWAPMIRAALPTQSEIKHKFGFSWQQFCIDTQNIPDTPGNTISQAASGVVAQLYEDLAQGLATAWDKTLSKKDTFAKDKLKGIWNIYDKAQACLPFAPQVRPFCDVLSVLTKHATNPGASTEDYLMMRALVTGLSTPEAIQNFCEQMQDEQQVDVLISPFAPAPAQPEPELVPLTVDDESAVDTLIAGFILDEEEEETAPAPQGFVPDPEPTLPAEVIAEAEQVVTQVQQPAPAPAPEPAISISADLAALGFIPD